MVSLAAFIPIDRRQALVQGARLPTQMQGALLFADLSGYTALTQAFVRSFGPKRGVDKLTQVINHLFAALIEPIHAHGGSVVGFGGDALTCWFADDDGHRAIACAFVMQQVMITFAEIGQATGEALQLTLKTTVEYGGVRRFQVGDPRIQFLDLLAGNLMEQVTALQHYATPGRVVAGPALLARLGKALTIALRYKNKAGRVQGAAVSALLTPPPLPAHPWPLLTAADDETRLDEAQVRPWLLPPIYDRLRTGQAAFLADIRPVVILFVRFAGLEYATDPAVGQKLDAFICRVQQIITDHEGYLLKITVDDKGSYLLAAFGAPMAHDDDTDQALAAALVIRTTPAIFPFLQSVQMGISQGRTLAGAFGGPQRVAYDLLGDAVNLANRLMMLARPGQILVSEEVKRRAKQGFRFAPPLFRKLKGIAAATPIFALVDHLLSRSPRPNRRLIGRTQELAQMVHWLQEAAGGQGRIVRLEGASGIGKSHLAAAVMEEALQQGFTVATGACEISSQQSAYYPWQQLLRTWLGMTDEGAPAQEPVTLARQLAQLRLVIAETTPEKQLLLPLLGRLLNLPVPENPTTTAYDPQLRQAALFALIGDLIRVRAQATPLLLVMEDGQWMDEASQELILAVSRGLADARVLLLLVHRPLPPEEVADESWLAALADLPGCRHLLLGELPAPAVAEMAQARLLGRLSPVALALLQARAQGNPFCLEELITALCELGKLFYDAAEQRWLLSHAILHTLRAANCITKEPTSGEWVLLPDAPLASVDLEIPDSIHQLVLARIDRLPEACKLTLKVASVIGRAFPVDLLARAHPDQPPPATLQQHLSVLEENNLVYPNPTPTQPIYWFRHHMTQEVVYHALVEQQQHLVHGAVGYAWESIDAQAVEQLAYHFHRSGVRDKSLHYLELAARKAQRSYANRTALNYYNQALALEERWEWQQGRIEVLHILGQRAEERAALERLSQETAAPAFPVAYRWGEYYAAISAYGEAAAAFHRALADARAHGSFLGEVRCLTQLGFSSWRRGNYAQAQTHYHQALSRLQGHVAPDDEVHHVLTQTLNGLGTLYRQQGQMQQAEAVYTQALALSRSSRNRLEEARTLDNLGAVAFHQRQYARSLSYHEAALQLRRMIGDRTGEGASLCNLALTYQEQGDYGRALQCLSSAQVIHQVTGNRWEEVNVFINLGILYTELGDWQQARTHLEKGLAVAQTIGDNEGRAYLLSNLGLVALYQGQWAEAETHLYEGLAYMQREENQYQIAFFLSYLALVSLTAGDLEQAEAHATQALAIRRELTLSIRIADNLAMLAAIYLARGKLPQAGTYAQQVLAILEECHGVGPEFPQQDYWICYQVLLAQGAYAQANQALHAAYQLVMQRAQKIGDAALQRSFVEQVAVNRAIIACAERELGVGDWGIG